MTSDAGTAAIAASFGLALGGGIGPGAAEAAADTVGLPLPRRQRPFMPFNLTPAMTTATAVGSYIDRPDKWSPPAGWLWDVVALTAYGFTAGTLAVTLNFPLVTAAGNPYALEPVGTFTQAGVLTYSQKGMPLLDSTQRLVFTVTSTLTGFAQISGQVIAVPAERLSDYLG